MRGAKGKCRTRPRQHRSGTIRLAFEAGLGSTTGPSVRSAAAAPLLAFGITLFFSLAWPDGRPRPNEAERPF